MVISGAVLTPVGVVALAVLLAGVGIGVHADRQFREQPARREYYRTRGRQANVILAASVAPMWLFLASGITLLVLGKKKERDLRASAITGRGRFGLGMSGKF